MTNTIGAKKKLLVCLLAFAMGASALTGGILLDARAESVNATSLVTPSSSDVTVTAAKSYTTTQGDYTTSAGLYLAAPADKSLSYGMEFNGIFTGSTGIKAYFPGEGFWNINKEMVITVTSITDPDARFEIRIGGEWQQYGAVVYQWEGQELWRTRGTTFSASNTYYYKEGTYYQSGCKDVNAAQFIPAPGHFTDVDLGRKTAYFGIEMKDDGSVDVVLLSSHGDTYNNRITIASFEDDPDDFEPSVSDSGTTSNLPKIDLTDGYTIGFAFSDSDMNKSYDFLIESIATSATGDPYNDGGTVYALNTTTLNTEPAFYTKWKDTPIMTLADHAYLDSTYLTQTITLPEVTVKQAGQPSSFTGTITVTDSAGPQTVSNPDRSYTIRNAGLHTVCYAQSGVEIKITFYAGNASVPIANVIENAQGTVGKNTQGVNIAGSNGSNAYSGKLVGAFSDTAEIEFAFPDSLFDGTRGGEFVYIIRDLQGQEVFRVVYEGKGWNTSAYVVYGQEVRGYSHNGYINGAWNTYEAYVYEKYPNVGGGEGDWYYALPGLNAYNKEKYPSGTFKLFWEGSALCVGVDNRDNQLITIAKFDGSQKPSEELIGEDGYMLSTEEGAAWGLPLLKERLFNGYTVEFAFNGARQNSATFLSVNGISLANRDNLTKDYISSVTLIPDKAAVDGADVYVAQGLHAGTVHRVYSYAFVGASEGYEASWGESHQVFESDLDTFHTNTAVGNYTVSIPASEAEGGHWEDQQLNLHIEDAWTLSFNLKEGQVAEGSADPITFSAHTKFLLSVPEVERAFWQFDGWSTQENGSKWDGSFDAWNGNVTLYAQWKDVTPPTITLADGMKEHAEVYLQDGSFVISKADVIASDAAQPDAVTLTVQYKKVGAADYTTLQEDSVTIEGAEFVVGEWEIVYTVDGDGNGPVTFTRTVSVVDRAAPVVTVGNVERAAFVGVAVNIGGGVTARDADGEALSVNVIVVDENGKQCVVTGGVFIPRKAGVYTVSCTAADGSLIGHASYSITVIEDTIAPVLSVGFSDKTVSAGSTVDLPAGTATDNADANVAVTVTVTYGTENVQLSGNSFKAEKAGTYTVTWTARDAAGNTQTVSAHVTVQPAGHAGNVGLIVGIVVAVIAVIAVVVIVAVVAKKKKSAKTK